MSPVVKKPTKAASKPSAKSSTKPSGKQAAKPSPKPKASRKRKAAATEEDGSKTPKSRRVAPHNASDKGPDGEAARPAKPRVSKAQYLKAMKPPAPTTREGEETKRAASSVLTLPASVQLQSGRPPVGSPVTGTLSQRVASFLSSPACLTEHFLCNPLVTVPCVHRPQLPSSPLPDDHYTTIQNANAPHVVPILQAQMAVASAYGATETPNAPIDLVARVLLRKALVTVLQGAAGLVLQGNQPGEVDSSPAANVAG